jgi:hypothetical protein
VGGGSGRSGALRIATAIVGLLAGIITAVYVLGGLVIALRLLFDHFSLQGAVTAVGQLPRETVVATAMLNVLALAACVGLFATLAYGLADRPRPRGDDSLGDEEKLREDKLTTGKRWRVGVLFVFFLTIAVAGSLPALREAVAAEDVSPLVLPCIFAAAVTYGVIALGWYVIRRVARKDWSRAEKALAAGGIWAGIAVIPVLMLASAKPFERGQVCTEGALAPLKGRLVGESSSRVFLEEEFGEEAALVVLPADRVTRSEYGDRSSSFACPPPPGQKAAAKVAEAALGGHGSEREVRLATELRPRILLDSRERWRPIEIEAFLGEDFGRGRVHEACRGKGCEPVGSSEALRPGPGGPAYLDFHGEAKDGSDHAASRRPCHTRVPLAVDCNGGPRAVIYYRRTTHEGRWYWDYWWFMRFSHYFGPLDDCNPVNCSDHEGDWEGITVITTPSESPVILGAIYAAHRNRVLVDAGEMPLSGGRPMVFVAAGTHASYPYRCGKDCKQYRRIAGTARLPETPHDGSVAWGGNDDVECQRSRCVQPLPEVGEPSDLALPLAGGWAGWPGLWGETCHRGCNWPLLQGSPRSPGLQARFECPWAATDWALPARDGSGLSRAERAGDAERIFALCRAQRGGERGL